MIEKIVVVKVVKLIFFWEIKYCRKELNVKRNFRGNKIDFNYIFLKKYIFKLVSLYLYWRFILKFGVFVYILGIDWFVFYFY